jgi:perosamine synthetase
MTENKRYSLMKPSFSAESRAKILSEVDKILESGQLMFGHHNDQLESGFAEFVGTNHAVSLNSCTTALTLSLQYYNVAGGEVLVPSGSFVTDVSSILFAGATPVLVDIDPETLSFDLEDLEQKITPKSRAIIWVHLTGIISSKYQEFLDLAYRHNLPVIEDAAHAHGSQIDDKMAGSLTQVGCFSFYPTKIMTSGTGGILTTNDENLANFAKEMRIFGKDLKTGEIIHLGSDLFLDEVRACIANNQLQDLPQMIESRRRAADAYRTVLRNQPGIRLIDKPDNSQPAYYQFAVFLNQDLDVQALRQRLKTVHQIEAKAIYKPTHEEPVFEKYDRGDLHQTKLLLDNSICLPMHPAIDGDVATSIAQTLVAEVRKVL